jgi:hypothetical protein
MKIDNQLQELLNNKTVAYVCPGQHIVGSDLGEKIDSYDIVIRVNQKFSIPEDKKADYGSRIDIIFSAFNDRCLNECKRNWSFFENCKDLKMAVVTQLPDGPSSGFKKEFEEKLGIPYFVPDRQEMIGEIFKEAGTSCNTGLIGLSMILMCNVKKIFIAGMNFYNMGDYGIVYYDEYYDSITYGKGYDKQHAYNKSRIVTPLNTRWDIHNQHKQIIYFKKLLSKYEHKIDMDNYLSTHLPKYNKSIVGIIISDNQEINDDTTNLIKSVPIFDDIVTINNNNNFDKTLIDFLNKNSYSHVICIKYPFENISQQEMKIFTSYMMAYDLNFLISRQKINNKDIGFTNRIKPTDINGQNTWKECLIDINDLQYNVNISDLMLFGFKTEKFKNNYKEKQCGYIPDRKTDCFILNNMDHRGIYLPLLESLKIDLA